MADWHLPGTEQDTQSVSSDWKLVDQDLLDGVRTKEIRNVVRATRTLTEIWRSDWRLDDEPLDQVFQVALHPGAISAWHAHAETTDRLFAATGEIHLVLYDSRPESPTCGRLNEFFLSARRPLLVVVPPRIWHGITNRTSEMSVLINLTDRAYRYEKPDHWRLPADSPHVPYSFG